MLCMCSEHYLQENTFQKEPFLSLEYWRKVKLAEGAKQFKASGLDFIVMTMIVNNWK